MFARAHDPRHGEAVDVAPGVRRITCRNPGPMTFHGTGTLIVGQRHVAVIDPGPDDPEHLAALLSVLDGATVTHIVVTHTHRDHSPLARALRQVTGAPIVGCAAHATPAAEGGEGADHDHAPDQAMAEGDAIEGPGWTLRAIATPGHTANHLCFAFDEQNILFSGDTVMAWSTTVVSPPDGNMAAYCESLSRLSRRDERRFLPTHGPAVEDPQGWCAELLRHRLEREREILAALKEGVGTVPALVARIYAGIDPRVQGAAARSVLAHLEKLVSEGRAANYAEFWRTP
jgi:glyoxylase-like metal-dependent hydrolase (beta-lactamase superfamily II)